MPSLSRRREIDGRADRFETEVRQTEMLDKSFAEKRKFMCFICKRLFEEKSRTCPRCERGRTMGEIKPVNVSDGEFKRSLDRARGGRGAVLPDQRGI